MSISIVIPVFNEADNIGVLVSEILGVAASFPLREIVVVDDASVDGTTAVLDKIKKSEVRLRVVTHTERRGQSTAIHSGIQAARGDLIVTMDGDGQNDPADIIKLYEEYKKHAPATMVAGQRLKRQDNRLRLLSSRVANAVRSWILNDGVRDTGCGLKLFRRADYLALPFFNHQHRFLPALMKVTGIIVMLVDVGHRPRLRGVSKYGVMNRLGVGIVDLFGVRWLMARTRPPVKIKE